MSKCSVFIATSLDGFIARPDGSIDWLERANARVTPGEDCGFAEFMSSVDAIVMGRNTFELVASFPEWPYGTTPLVDGGLTIQSFLTAGLIDEITITTIPVLLGSGRPLFGSLPADVRLELLSSKAYDFGFVQSRYRIESGRD